MIDYNVLKIFYKNTNLLVYTVIMGKLLAHALALCILPVELLMPGDVSTVLAGVLWGVYSYLYIACRCFVL